MSRLTYTWKLSEQPQYTAEIGQKNDTLAEFAGQDCVRVNALCFQGLMPVRAQNQVIAALSFPGFGRRATPPVARMSRAFRPNPM
ncbi:MAG: hypothetical protein AAGE76_00115 [Pseudomonadota bacterium]